MKQYIVSWTATLEAENADEAVELATADFNEGNIAPEVEALRRGQLAHAAGN
jgi:hypothetical protein